MLQGRVFYPIVNASFPIYRNHMIKKPFSESSGMAKLRMKKPTVKTTIIFVYKIILVLFGKPLEDSLSNKYLIHVEHTLARMASVSLSFTVRQAPVHLHLAAGIFEKDYAKLLLIQLLAPMVSFCYGEILVLLVACSLFDDQFLLPAQTLHHSMTAIPHHSEMGR